MWVCGDVCWCGYVDVGMYMYGRGCGYMILSVWSAVCIF